MAFSESSKDVTTFIAPYGGYTCNILLFGISNPPKLFQREMQKILIDIKGVVCHMNDVSIFATTKNMNSRILEKVVEKFQAAELTLNKTNAS